MKQNQRACLPERRGSGLVFAIVLLFVILGMVVTLSSVTMLETKMNQKTKSSVGAFYSSESGVEWALNKIATNSGTAYLSTILDPASNFASCPTGVGTCKVYFLDSAGKVMNGISSETIADIKAVRSVGTQGNETQRAIEAVVASNEGGCYVSYKSGCSLSPTKSDCCDTANGFTNQGDLGSYGCCLRQVGSIFVLRQPGGRCDLAETTPALLSTWKDDSFGCGNLGEAFLCCQ